MEFLLLSASPESFSSAASVASSVSAAMSLSSDLVFLESFFTVNHPSRFLGRACIAQESGVSSDLPNFSSGRVYRPLTAGGTRAIHLQNTLWVWPPPGPFNYRGTQVISVSDTIRPILGPRFQSD